ncbi:FAD:protein FMN transferase [Sulfuricurvum sp.]|uniref:FAD:protein FMN transferase n=1 Tax=Sulfuricurvum sp. TaxID=2025608 RepID=UPI00262A05EC|nr:FAD:protein FMN transferase [Sulfuricurvum sp.]MDD2265430.1 FAD:protein FMN transferase [Sulfuricurvum sp.]MDD2784641.1 FAD:protein FMN transferase [Sulfuricurvum sp.]
MKTLFVLLLSLSILYAAPRTQVHMGTLISIDVDDQNLSDTVFDLFTELDNRLSTYKNDSEISRLNREYKLNASNITRKILERSLEMNHISDGAFDITVGSLTHGAYRFGYDDEHLPSKELLQKSEKLVGSYRLRIEENDVKTLPGTIIDLGGIGKGYAVDLAIDELQKNDVSKAIVAASGDIGCLGDCKIEIQDPFHPNAHIATIRSTLPRFAVSTSGNYERYIKNKSNNHLLDPKTGQSEHSYASVTLIDSGDNTRIDALATAVSIMKEKKAIAMLQKLNIGYVLIHNNGTILKSAMPQGVSITFVTVTSTPDTAEINKNVL